MGVGLNPSHYHPFLDGIFHDNQPSSDKGGSPMTMEIPMTWDIMGISWWEMGYPWPWQMSHWWHAVPLSSLHEIDGTSPIRTSHRWFFPASKMKVCSWFSHIGQDSHTICSWFSHIIGDSHTICSWFSCWKVAASPMGHIVTGDGLRSVRLIHHRMTEELQIIRPFARWNRWNRWLDGAPGLCRHVWCSGDGRNGMWMGSEDGSDFSCGTMCYSTRLDLVREWIGWLVNPFWSMNFPAVHLHLYSSNFPATCNYWRVPYWVASEKGVDW